MIERHNHKLEEECSIHCPVNPAYQPINIPNLVFEILARLDKLEQNAKDDHLTISGLCIDQEKFRDRLDKLEHHKHNMDRTTDILDRGVPSYIINTETSEPICDLQNAKCKTDNRTCYNCGTVGQDCSARDLGYCCDWTPKVLQSNDHTGATTSGTPICDLQNGKCNQQVFLDSSNQKMGKDTGTPEEHARLNRPAWEKDKWSHTAQYKLSQHLQAENDKLQAVKKVLIKEVLASLSGEGIFYSDNENIKELKKISEIRRACGLDGGADV